LPFTFDKSAACPRGAADWAAVWLFGFTCGGRPPHFTGLSHAAGKV
jgi:hypothetical protein